MKSELETISIPTEGKWFEVKPLSIDQKLFKESREDEKQEATRNLILEAFVEMENNPEKYGKNFKTMMPKKRWPFKTVAQFKEIASKLGDHNADWVEQAFEWAQRLVNGESWKAICNDRDTANWHRLVVWKNGYARLIGGSKINSNRSPASYVDYYDFDDKHILTYAVPLVVSYEE